jgi:tetratricopeptide (TPR) repeat protein
VNTVDKYEYKLKTDQMLELMEQGAYNKAAEIANEIDWKRVRNITMLTNVSDIYERTGDYQKSYEILNIASSRSDGSRKVLYRLCAIALKTGNVDEAIDYYEEFVKVAPRDPNQYILKYKILRARRISLEQQIEALEEFKKSEYIEEWAFELAKLYQEAGMTVECLEECDDLILWFSEGKFVYKAMELKMQYKPLTPSQQEKYNHRFDDVEEEAVPAMEAGTEELPDITQYRVRFSDDEEQSASEESDFEENPVGIGESMKLEDALRTLLQPQVENEGHEESEDLYSTTGIRAGMTEEEIAIMEQAEVLQEDVMRSICESVVQEMESLEEQMQEEIEEKSMHEQEEQATPVTQEANAEVTEEASGQEGFEESIEVQEVVEDMSDLEEDIQAIESVMDLELVQEMQGQGARMEVRFDPDLEELKAEPLQEQQFVEDLLQEIGQEEEEVVSENDDELPDDILRLLDEIQGNVPVEPKVEVVAEEEKVASKAVVQPVVEAVTETEHVSHTKHEVESESDTFVASELEPEVKTEIEEVLPVQEPKEEIQEEIILSDEDENSILLDEFAEELDESYEDTLDSTNHYDDFRASFEEEFRPNAGYQHEEDDREIPDEEEIDIMSATTPLSRKETAKLIATGRTSPLPMNEISDALSMSDTGFVVQGRYDLEAQSGIGTRAGLTEEQKKLFSYFVPVRGMSEQLVDVLAHDRSCTKRGGTSKTGNLIIIGNKGNGKTVLAVDVVKAIQKQRNIRHGKVAIVTGESLNRKKIREVAEKLYGGALIIEKASKMNEKTVQQLNRVMEENTGEMLVVLEEQRKPLDRLLSSNREFRRKFTCRLEVPILINDELVTFGQTYSHENGYQIDEMGILALYSRIDALQRDDHGVTITEVKDVIDEAIEHSQRASAKNLMKRVFGRSTDHSDRIILTEKDFNI